MTNNVEYWPVAPDDATDEQIKEQQQNFLKDRAVKTYMVHPPVKPGLEEYKAKRLEGIEAEYAGNELTNKTSEIEKLEKKLAEKKQRLVEFANAEIKKITEHLDSFAEKRETAQERAHEARARVESLSEERESLKVKVLSAMAEDDQEGVTALQEQIQDIRDVKQPRAKEELRRAENALEKTSDQIPGDVLVGARAYLNRLEAIEGVERDPFNGPMVPEERRAAATAFVNTEVEREWLNTPLGRATLKFFTEIYPHKGDAGMSGRDTNEAIEGEIRQLAKEFEQN